MIEINNVSFAYKRQKKKQISDVTITIKAGEFILLCGKSGSGKTTATKLINGLIPYFSEGNFTGKVEINGKDTRKLRTYQIAKSVGSIFQNPKTQFFNLDTDSELTFGLENIGSESKDINERVKKVVGELKVEKLLNRSVFELSGGEKQILAIASVYATNPDVYVFDEPSANIDEKGIDRLASILKNLKEQGKTVIIAEHRLYYLMDLIDKVAYFKNGKIEKIYSGEEFRAIDDDTRKEIGLRTFKPIEINPYIQSLKFKDCDNLVIKNLEYKYKKNQILSGISLSANVGDVIAVTGINGAGKSTLMRCLCGLIKESNGEILYRKKPYKYKERRSLCYMIMQDVIHQLFAESVKDEFHLLNSSITESIVKGILEELDLVDFIDRHPMCLSGGQMQRLAVAVGMLADRDIIIFDEPTSGLDYSNMLVVSKMIRKLSKSKIVFIISHDRELIANTCSKVLTLSNGMIE